MDLVYLLTVAGLAASDPSNFQTYLVREKTMDQLQVLREKSGVIHDLLVELNHENLCLYPAAFMEGSVFLKQFYDDNGVTQEFKDDITWSNQQIKFKDVKLTDESHIPFLTHRIWFTNPLKPRQLSNDKGYKEWVEISQSQGFKSFDKEQYPFIHYLWTNDIEALSETRKWAESIGVTLRNINELEYISDDFNWTINELLR